MIKKVILFLLIAVFSVGACACNVVPEKTYSASSEDYFSFEAVEGGYKISAAEGAELPKILKLPENHEGEAVVEVATKGFNGAKTVEKIVIPTCYRKIGLEAFAYMPSLRVVEIGTVGTGTAAETVIAFGAFENNSSLTRVKLGDCVAEIGEYAFAKNLKLGGVIIGKGLKTVADTAFEGCEKISFDLDKDNPNFIVKDNALTAKTAGDGTQENGNEQTE